jgi:hypothetical protein
MKSILVYIMITGILPGAQALSRAALKCYDCTDFAYDSSNSYVRASMDSMISILWSNDDCDGAESAPCTEGSDSCVSRIMNYTIAIGDLKLADINQVINICSQPLDNSTYHCDKLESLYSAFHDFKDVTCKTEHCTTDGCNNKRASTTGLSASFLLLSSIAAMNMFN